MDLFSSYGGITANKVVTGILKHLLSKTLAIQTNFIGANEKISFKDSKLLEIVIGNLFTNMHNMNFTLQMFIFIYINTIFD